MVVVDFGLLSRLGFDLMIGFIKTIYTKLLYHQIDW